MLYKQENITLVDEVRKTGRGNRVWIEILGCSYTYKFDNGICGGGNKSCIISEVGD